MAIKVRALSAGFHGNARRRVGEVFEVANEKELGKWMQRLDKPGAVAPPSAASAPPTTAKKFEKYEPGPSAR